MALAMEGTLRAPPARPRRGGWWLVAGGLLLLAALATLARYGPETAVGRHAIEGAANGLDLGPVGHLQIQGLSGDPWVDPHIARLTLSDKVGVWLDARGVELTWRPADLLRRRLRVTDLTIRELKLQHRPTLTAGHGPAGRPPVSVAIDRLRARIEMAPAFALRQGDYDLTGAFDLERSGAVRTQLAAASRLHAGDHLDIKADVETNKTFNILADAREAQGGALAGMLGLAANQPFLLTAKAAGSLRQGHVFVDTRLGQAAPVEVRGQWTPAGGQASGDIQLAASSLLTHYSDIVGPEIHFDIAGHRAADGFYAFALAANGQSASLAARGEADAGKLTTGPGGVAIDARVARADRLIGVAKMGAARLVGTLTGDRKQWRIVGAASIDQVAEGPYALARIAGPIRLGNQGRDLLIQAQVTGEGGAGQGLLAALLGARPSGSAQLTRFADGRLLMRQLAVAGVGLKASGSGSRGLLGDLSFNGVASFSNLTMAHAGASGLVNFGWTASQAGKSPWKFSVDAHGKNFGSGWGEADRLLGRAPHLVAQMNWASGVLAVTGSTLTGASGRVSGIGTLGGDGALALKLDWNADGPFEAGPFEVVGAAKGTGGLTGTLGAPRVDLLADLGGVSTPGLPLTDAHLALSFQHTPAGGDGRFALKAVSAYGAATASSDFRFVGDGVDLTGLDVNGGGVAATGALALRKGEPSSADLTLAIGPGAVLAQGHANGRVRILASAKGATVDISLAATEAILRQGGIRVKRLTFTAAGPLSRLPYKLAASGPSAAGPWRLNGSGDLVESGTDRLATLSGSAHLRRADFRTLSPARIRMSADGLVVHAAVGVGAGHADVDIDNVHGAASVKATLSDIDMALLDEDYVGKLSGQLALSGRGNHLSGGLDARLAGAGGRDLRGAPPVDGEVTARLAGQEMSVRFDLGNSAGVKADGEVGLPVDASAEPFNIAFDHHRPLAGHFAVKGEIKPIWDLLLTGADSLAGQVDASMTLGGTLADPSAVGQVALDNGRFQDEDTGLKLQNVSLRAQLAGNAVDVSHFTAVDGSKGQISGSGRASLARDGVSTFRADLAGFRLIDTDIARVTASGPVSLSRTASGRVQVSGALTIDNAQISPNPPVASGVAPMDVVEIHRPDDLDDEPTSSAIAHEAPVALDVSIKAPRGVFLKGRGLNLEMALDAHVGGIAAAPILTGRAHVVRGDYDFAGQRFQLDERSIIYLGSTPQTIRLDLTATRDDPALTAVIKIAGTAAKPIITLSSTPSLPQDEILSQVLFGASASQLSGLEAAQLASAVAGLSGGGGFDLIGGLRSLAHLDRLAVADSTITGTTISGGKYIGDKLYLQLTGGGREGEGAQVEWRVRKRLSLVGKLGSQGDSQIAIRWRRSY
ncbi:MAG: translocation/assembly module TamB domain-containing protein [Caulobacteraceae bacterium]